MKNKIIAKKIYILHDVYKFTALEIFVTSSLNMAGYYFLDYYISLCNMQIGTFADMVTDHYRSSSLPEERIPRNAARAHFVVINQSARQFCLSSDTR